MLVRNNDVKIEERKNFMEEKTVFLQDTFLNFHSSQVQAEYILK